MNRDRRTRAPSGDPVELTVLLGLLARFGIRPKRSMGQNFLIDARARDRIVEIAEVAQGERMLEIGAGVGTLTLALAAGGAQLTTVELDRQCHRALEEVMAGQPGVRTLLADVIGIDLEGLFPGGGELIIGNIPYQISNRLLAQLLISKHRPSRLVLMVQKEVAERWTAAQGRWSMPTLLINMVGSAEICEFLPARSFHPQPQVESAIVRIRMTEPQFEPEHARALLDFAGSVFRFKRKQLRNTLVAQLGVPGGVADDMISTTGCSGSSRPEQLRLQQWLMLFQLWRRWKPTDPASARPDW